MSYCRFFDADAYIFRDSDNSFCCCACYFSKGLLEDKFILSLFGLFFHCIRHSLSGQNIPFHVYKRIFIEMIQLKWFNF